MGADAAAQEEFGPYLVFERLGVGGMATVHRALERGIEGFERVVALKRLLPHLAADASFIKAFVREAKLAAFLNHANIVQLFELGRVGSAYFISMEYIDGRDIRRILRHARRVCGPPPIHVTVGLLLQLCDALDYAHHKVDDAGHPLGLVHRDVSPSNVLVTTHGQVKVIDFGIAKAQSAQLLTQTGRVKGKLAYMAPEALAGKELDARSDLFAAGVIAHELLTARPLFATKNEYQTLMKLQRGDVQPPSTFNQSCPPALDAIVLKALARDPDDRFASASDLRDALHAMRKQHHLQTTERDIVTWLDWAFSLEMPSSGFTANHELDPASGLIDVQARNRAARPKRTEDDELVDIAWGDGNDQGNGQPVLLDDVPDVSDKLVPSASALGADVRLDLDDLADDMPTPVPSYSNRHEVDTAVSRTPAPRPTRRPQPLTPPFPTRSEAAGSAGVPVPVAAAGDRSQAVSSGVPAAPASVAASAAVVGGSVRVMMPPRVRTITSAQRAAASPTPAPPPAVGSTEIPRDGLPTGAAPREPVATRSVAAAVSPAGGAPEPWAPRGLPSASTPPRDRLVLDAAPGTRPTRLDTATTESAPPFPSSEFDSQPDPGSTDRTPAFQLDEAAASDTLRSLPADSPIEPFVRFHSPTPVPASGVPAPMPRAESAATRGVPPAADQFSDADADTVYVGPARPPNARAAAALLGRPTGAHVAGAPAKSSALTPTRSHPPSAAGMATLPGRPARPSPTREQSVAKLPAMPRESSAGLQSGPYISPAGAQSRSAKPATGTHGIPGGRPGQPPDPQSGPYGVPGGPGQGAGPYSGAQGTPSGRRGQQRPDDRSGRHAVPTQRQAEAATDGSPNAPHGHLRDQPSGPYPRPSGLLGQPANPQAGAYAAPNAPHNQLRDQQSGPHPLPGGPHRQPANPQAGAYAAPNTPHGHLRDRQSGAHPLPGGPHSQPANPQAGAYAAPNTPHNQLRDQQSGAYPLPGGPHRQPANPQAGAYAAPNTPQGHLRDQQSGAYPLPGGPHSQPANPQAGAYAAPNTPHNHLHDQHSGAYPLPGGPHSQPANPQAGAYAAPNSQPANPQAGAYAAPNTPHNHLRDQHSGAYPLPGGPHGPYALPTTPHGQTPHPQASAYLRDGQSGPAPLPGGSPGGQTTSPQSGVYGFPVPPQGSTVHPPTANYGVAPHSIDPQSQSAGPYTPHGPQVAPSGPLDQSVVSNLPNAPVAPHDAAILRARRRKLRIALLAAAAIVAAAAAAAAVVALSAAPTARSEPRDPAPSPAPPARGKTAATLKFVLVPADAAIIIEGKPVSAGSPSDIEIEPGVHQIEIHRDGYKGWLTSIDLAVGETRPIHVALEPLAAPSDDATLTLSSTPPGLEIVIDGASIAPRTPARLPLKIGPHTVVLRMNGVDVWRTALEARSSAVYDYSPTVAGAAPRPATTAPSAPQPADPARPTEDTLPSPAGTPPSSPSGTPPSSPPGSPPSSPSGTPPSSPPGTPRASPSGTPRASPSGTPRASPSGTPVSLPSGTPPGNSSPDPDPAAPAPAPTLSRRTTPTAPVPSPRLRAPTPRSAAPARPATAEDSPPPAKPAPAVPHPAPTPDAAPSPSAPPRAPAPSIPSPAPSTATP